MNVQQLINALQTIQNKELPVCIEDWNSQCQVPALADVVELFDGKYLHCGVDFFKGPFVYIGTKEVI